MNRRQLLGLIPAYSSRIAYPVPRFQPHRSERCLNFSKSGGPSSSIPQESTIMATFADTFALAAGFLSPMPRLCRSPGDRRTNRSTLWNSHLPFSFSDGN